MTNLSYVEIQIHIGELFKERLGNIIAPMAMMGTLDKASMMQMALEVAQDINIEAASKWDTSFVPSVCVRPVPSSQAPMGQVVVDIHMVCKAGLSLN